MPEFDHEIFLKSLTRRPGVYRMLNADGDIIYVGKARNLKNRVSTYFGSKAFHPKTQALMNQTCAVEVTVTESEQAALLLESNLIKKHRPRFNVVLRDDKSYPYIRVTIDHEYPRFEFYRGSRKKSGQLFGPFPSAASVRYTLGELQKLFQVRQCQDSFFNNRSRPCLQHQIKRCSGPCVGLIEPDEYARDVGNAVQFLQGKNDLVVANLVERMDEAAETLDYELAARYRDQITKVKTVQSAQHVAGNTSIEADALSVCEDGGVFCVSKIMVRAGRVLGGRTFFPRTAPDTEGAEVLSAFLAQHYFAQSAPREVLINQTVDDRALFEQAFTEFSDTPVSLRTNVRGYRRKWLEMATTNAQQALISHRASNATLRQQYKSLTELLQLDEPPNRIECFDISHSAGDKTVASCVVFGSEGAVKSDYRRFNIKTARGGDDYGAIGEVIQRRYLRTKKGEAPVPDLIIIDGGRGQLGAAQTALEELQLSDLPMIGVAKGVARKAGREKIYRVDRPDPLDVPGNSAAMRLIQQIRDEAHRFAITGHRQRLGGARKQSALESIVGLGPARRKALLNHFGGLQGVRKASVDDLTSVNGISRTLAERIFAGLHDGSIA